MLGAVPLPGSLARGLPRNQLQPSIALPRRSTASVAVAAASGAKASASLARPLRLPPLSPSTSPLLSSRRRTTTRALVVRVSAHGNHSHDHDHHDHHHGHDHGRHGGSCCSSSFSSCSSSDDEDDGGGHHHHHHHDHHHHSHTKGSVELLARKAADVVGLGPLSRKLDHNVPALALAAAALLLAAGVDFLSTSTKAPTLVRSLLEKSPIPAATLRSFLATSAYVLAGLPDLLELCYVATASLPDKFLTFELGLGQGPVKALSRVDTHSLMAASAAAAAALGSPLEGALLLVLFGASHALEAKLATRAKGDLGGLLSASPPTAVLVSSSSLNPTEGSSFSPDFATARVVPAASIEIGQVTLVRPGEACAHDGVVAWGTALVSAEHITGESLPRRARVGDLLPAGAVSRDGALALRATAKSRDSAPARIAQLAAAAQKSKPPLAAWLDEIGAQYSRWVLVASLGAFLGLLALGVPLRSASSASCSPPAAAGLVRRGAAYRAMAALTAASPCALALAPLAYVAAVARAARRGVVLRGGGATLDALLRVRGVGLDKTGTLTTGELRCVGAVDVKSDGGEDGDGATSSSPSPFSPLSPSSSSTSAALSIAAALSLRSTHPVSSALVSAARTAGVVPLVPEALSEFELVPGSGVTAELNSPSGSDKETVFLGASDWVASSIVGRSGENEAAARSLVAAAAEAERGAVTVSALARVKRSSPPPAPEITLFAFEDAVRGLSASAVESLSSGGVKKSSSSRRRRPPLSLRVLTGDNASAAERVARALGLPSQSLRSGLSPEEKVAALRTLREEVNENDEQENPKNRFGVMMVGDGINDAPALSAADVGVALSASPSSFSSRGETSSSSSPSTTAQELAADVLLLGGAGIEQLPFLLDLAALTRRVVSQNLAIAACSVAVLSLPALCGFLPLWLAVALHEGSTLVVALNSLRPLAFRGQELEEGKKKRLVSSSTLASSLPKTTTDVSSSSASYPTAAAVASSV